MSLSSVANPPLKHNNPQFYIGKTEVRSRSDWSGGALLGTKIHPVGPFLTQFNVAKQAFPATKRLKGRSYVLQCLALRFHFTHCVYSGMVHIMWWVAGGISTCKTNNSWWSWPCCGTHNLSPCGPKYHLGRHSIRPSIHPCTQLCMHRHVYTAAWCTLCDGWRVGLVHAKCHCNHIRDNRYRDQPLVTLPYLKLV